MIFVNFKTYPEGTGETAVKLAGICAKVAKTTGVKIIPVVQAVDLWRLKESGLEVWAQHVDWQLPGQWTGFTNLEAVMRAGGQGTLINHAEHQLPPGTIKQTIKRIESLRSLKVQGFKRFETMVCCRTLGQAEKLVKFKPDFIAYEPLELIGGEISVAQSQPAAIGHFVEMADGIPVIIGAGIKEKKDVEIGLKLGAQGILVASGVILADDPGQKLLELAEAFAR